MPNDDYIKRSDALKAARYYKNRREENHVPSIDDVHLTESQLLAQAINSIPAADVEPKRKTGHWIKDGDDVMCSVCDEILCGEAWEDLDPIDDIGLHYCPNCGSKMDRGADNGNVQ